jgi:hypothetical protein
MPPTIVQLAGEACCLVFAKKPSYSNFKMLLSDSNFLKTIVEYDVNNTSNYVIRELAKYVNNPDFNSNKATSVSFFAGSLINWLTVVYEYGKLNTTVIIMFLYLNLRKIYTFINYIIIKIGFESFNKKSLKELLVKFSSDSFSWPQYFVDSASLFTDLSKKLSITKFNELIEQVDFTEIKFFTYNEYLKFIETTNDDLKKKLEKEFLKFPEKFLKSNCAQVDH